VMIDNYDSFTHNLVRYFRELGQQVMVFRNDAVSVQALRDLSPAGIIISPGPGTPTDAGISLAAIESFAGQLPLLGVCLGHQAIAQAYGADIVRAYDVMHGKTSLLESKGQGLFRDLPRQFRVTRYHSLVVAADSMPNALRADAWVKATVAGDRQGDIMALSDEAAKVYGVQFHPESVLTEQGHQILAAFCQQSGLNVDVDFSELTGSLR
ncbi:MAG: aminodeoxychorismate/anthranilate synthase component II, partial [Idiomarina sp.]|nr:aminodeoxychorismate/anthranilate synthase component II [Idiomarina sp.]